MVDGDTIPYRAGSVFITLVANGRTFVVTTQAGVEVLSDWTRTYATEDEARDAARHVALAFTAHGTDVAVERRRHWLAFELMRLLYRRDPASKGALRTVQTEADSLSTLAELASLADLRQHHIAAQAA
jgi:hypothetical protein